TNILVPAVSLITRIDFDHENFLGHSIEEIASEKAGILKPGVPVVLAEQQRPEARDTVLARAAKLRGCVIEPAIAFRIEDVSMREGRAHARITELASGWAVEVSLSIPGRFQLQNALSAIAAARLLREQGRSIGSEAITVGIANTVWPGRLEKVQSRPDVYLDGAHNPSAAAELAAFWHANFAGRRIFLIFGALRDKAVDEIAGQLFPFVEEVIFTEPRTSRAISATQVADIAAHHATYSSVIPDAEHAIDYALSKAAPDDAIFITGSLYLVGQLRQYWKNRTQV